MKRLRPMEAGGGTLRDRINGKDPKKRIENAPGGWRAVDPKSPLLKAYNMGREYFWKKWDLGVAKFQTAYSYLVNNLPPALVNLLNPTAKVFAAKGEGPDPSRGSINELIAATVQRGVGR
jgi:hypothetical protein